MKSIDPSEMNIIDYLSGEMTAEESKRFEQQLDDNPLLKQQVEDMRLVKGQLKVWGDKEIPLPEFEPNVEDSAIGESKANFGIHSTGNQKRIPFPSWLKYAASFVGFILFLQFSGLKLTQQNNTLMLSFGEPVIENLNKQTVDDIVNKAIENYASKQNSQLAAFKNQMNSDLMKINTAVTQIGNQNESNIATLENVFNQSLDQQYTMIKSIEDNQRQELEHSFTGMMEFVENNRLQDQYKIQNAFSDIATAINNQQYQTNALLTSITEEKPGLKSY
ncbi:MAG: hypothetical protein P1U56_00775 [Saprospiraceae bacterium]|nr:hypothetical protein [Saprospiraceae bacterium]